MSTVVEEQSDTEYSDVEEDSDDGGEGTSGTPALQTTTQKEQVPLEVLFTPIKIHTMTCIGTIYAVRRKDKYIKEKVLAQILADNLMENPILRTAILGIKCGNILKGIPVSEKRRKQLLRKKGNEAPIKDMGHQVTVVFTVPMKSTPTTPESNKRVNVKIWTNGRLQITGCKSKEEVNALLVVIKKVLDAVPEKNLIFSLPNERIDPIFESILMINSGFTILDKNTEKPIEIDKYKLYYLLAEKYPTINQVCKTEKYNALKISFPVELPKKKIVTIAVFHTGNIIITGAIAFSQITEAYGFITNILKENIGEIVLK